MCWSVYADPLLRKISKLPPSMILLIQCSNTLLSSVHLLHHFPIPPKSFTCPTLKTDHSSITSAASARNIRVMFFNCDQMREHITSVCRASHFHPWNIGSTRHYLTPETYDTLAHSHISFKLNNFDSLSIELPATQINRFSLIQTSVSLPFF